MTKLRPGFKYTDVGVIPEDWQVRKLSDISTIIRGASPRPKGDKRYYGGSIPRLMVEDVTRDGKFTTPRVDFLTQAGAKLSRFCKKGTLTIVCSGTVGIPSFLAVDACIHDGFLALVNMHGSVYDDFLYHQLSTLRNKFESSATHGGVFTNLTTEILNNFQVFLPQLSEQRAIAEALSDMDALLNTLDRLIAKKRAIKQAAMQQLLTGQTRLPGFSAEWKIWRLGGVANIFKGQGLSKEKLSSNGIHKCILYGELFTTYDRIIRDVKSSTNLYEGAVSIYGDVLIPGSTTTVGIDLATASALMADNILLGGDINIIRVINSQCYPVFLAYYLTEVMKKEIAERAQGITIIHIYGKSLLDIDIRLPSISEQTAITVVLSDMDAEIEALEAKHAKTAALKQGMLQELLTGRTRLTL